MAAGEGDTQFRARRPRAVGRFTTRRVEGEQVVLDLASGSFFSLNEVAAFIWDRIDGRRTVGDLLAAVLAEYEVDEPTAAADIRELMAQLVSQGAVELIDGPPQPA